MRVARTMLLRCNQLVLVVAMAMPAVVDAAELEPPSTAALRNEPVTTANTPAGRAVRKLASLSAVAGNVGDVYDNRDRGHSLPTLNWFPQLQRVVYDEAEREANADWAMADTIRPYIVVGNSSTAAEPDKGGSNARSLYLNPRGTAFAFQQYLLSNLYIYPEHRDYERGVFGIDNRGDAFPLNTPYLLVSLGSSGSDKEFLHALFWTLAAFQPEVKQQLYARKLLMPTLQMILRRSLKHVRSDQDYLSGSAHPPVFDGDQLDPEAMVKLAHRITPGDLPPLALLRVIEESPSQPGRDYFLPQQPERWVETPAAIGRIFRGPRPHYRMVLDASLSTDINRRDLTYHWRVLRGDAERITITPLDADHRRIELLVPFHNEAFSAPDDPAVQTRRIDIGCFVHNGRYFSPPAFVSIYMPEHQRMTIDEHGRVLEIGYGAVASVFDAQESPISIKNAPRLLTHLISDTPEATVLWKAIPDDLRQQLQEVRTRHAAMAKDLAESEQRLRDAEAAWQAATDETDKKRLARARDREAAYLERSKRAISSATLQGRGVSAGQTTQDLITAVLSELYNNPRLFFDQQDEIMRLAAPPSKYLDRLASIGLASSESDGPWQVTPLQHSGDLTVFEQNQLRGLNAWILHRLLNKLTPPPSELRPDPRIALPHLWRDVYSYDSEGNMTGWTRYEDGKQVRFDGNGHMLPSSPGESPRPMLYAPSSRDIWKPELTAQPADESPH